MEIPNPFGLRIHGLFIANESLYEEERLKYNITLIILMMKNISDICISIDEKYFRHMY
jgi:hypothetical protein